MKKKLVSVLLVFALGVCCMSLAACKKDNTGDPDNGGNTVDSGVTDIELNYTSYILDLNDGETVQLTAEITPSDAAVQTLIWESSDESVATVSATGKVTPVGAGEAEIKVYSADKKVSAVCEITVE